MGKTVIVSSHLLSEIEIIANRMIIIHKGKKVSEGAVADLLDPSHTVVLLETTNNELSSSRLKEWGYQISSRTTGNFLQVDINKNKIPELVTKLSGSGIGIITLQPRHSLEDYFLSLTNNESNVEPFAN